MICKLWSLLAITSPNIQTPTFKKAFFELVFTLAVKDSSHPTLISTLGS